MVETLERAGMTRDGILKTTGIDATVFSTPNARLNFKQIGALWDLAVTRYGPSAGLEIGKNLRITHWQTLGFGLASSMSSSEWLARLTNYTGLMTNGLTLQTNTKADLSTELSLRFNMPVSHEAVRMDCILKAAFEMIHTLFGIDMRPLVCLELTRPEPPEPAPWVDAFGSKIMWGCSETKVIAGPAVHQIVIASADPELSQTHNTMLQLALSRLEKSTLEQEVSRHVAKGLAEGRATLQHVAAQMGTSPRSLQRRLDESGRSFRELKEQVRLDNAKLLLQQGLSFGEISLRLGYSEVTNFHAAFKRWTGLNASEYLEDLGNKKPATKDGF